MKTKWFCVLMASALLCGLLAGTALADTKDVWIDNTVDASRSTVVGQVVIEGENEPVEVYREAADVTFSNPRSSAVQELIEEAEAAARRYAEEHGLSAAAACDIREVVEKVFDNRKYETIEDSDAVLIGDADYFGDIGNTQPTTRTHVASGDYGKLTTYTVSLAAKQDSGYAGIALGTVGEGGYTYKFVTEGWPDPGDAEVGPACMNSLVQKGTEVILTAEPKPGWLFAGWYEGVIGESYYVEGYTDRLICADAEYSFTAAGDVRLCLVFKPDPMEAVRILQAAAGLADHAEKAPAAAAAILKQLG